MGLPIRWPWLVEELDLDISEDDTMSSRLRTVTNWMMTEYNIRQRDINRGYCFIWAFLVYGAIDGTKLRRDYEGEAIDHAFIEFRGRAYDADNLRGVNLSLCDDFAMFGEVLPIDLKTFCHVWTEVGLCRDHFIDLLRDLYLVERDTTRRTIRSLRLDFLK